MRSADCPRDTYNDGIDKCSPCSTICDNAKARGTLSECRKELSCAAYYRLSEATTALPSSDPDSTGLPEWAFILLVVLGVIAIIITSGVVIYVSIRWWKKRRADRNVRYTVQATDEPKEVVTDSGVSTGGSDLSSGSSSGSVPVSTISTTGESGTNVTGMSEMGQQRRYMVTISDAQDQ